MDVPITRYARSGGVSIAYQVLGAEGPDLVWLPSLTHHVELAWESPAHARFLRRLAAISRLIVFDKRGTGMSDRLAEVDTLEARMDDIRKVMDAAGSERAIVFGLGEAGPQCILFAATYPERTAGLLLMNSAPRITRAPDLSWLPTRGQLEQRIEEVKGSWGDQDFMERTIRLSNPSITDEELPGFVRVSRLSVGAGEAAAYLRANLEVDVREVLPFVRVPTLVLQREDLEQPPGPRAGQYLAERIPGARLAELPGRDFGPPFGDQEALFTELERFVRELSEWREADGPERVLTTVLFTDIVGSTEQTVQLGDVGWRELLQRHHEVVREQLRRFRGKELDTAGDGVFASFDGPARAIRCSSAIVESLQPLGLEVRAGVHTGECELLDGKVTGIAVHTGARVAALARSGEVLVTSTVRDLVAGSGLTFTDRGEHELKGLAEQWRLYAVAQDRDDRGSE